MSLLSARQAAAIKLPAAAFFSQYQASPEYVMQVSLVVFPFGDYPSPFLPRG